MNNSEDILSTSKLAKEYIDSALANYVCQKIKKSAISGKTYYVAPTQIDIAIDFLKTVRNLMDCDLEGREP